MCIRDRVFFNELRYVLLQLLRWNLPCSKAHERFDNFAAQSVRLSNNAGFCYCWVFYKCAFNLKRTHTFSRGLYDVIDAPHKKEVTIFITKRTISRLEPSGNLKVAFKLLFVSPYSMHHRRPRRLYNCLLYTSDAADDLLCVDLGGRRIIKKKKKININSKEK